jgi:hypothetical protein
MTFLEAVRYLRKEDVKVNPTRRFHGRRGYFFRVEIGGTFPPLLLLPQAVCSLAEAAEENKVE